MLREASQSHLRIMDPTSIMCERLIKKKSERKKEKTSFGALKSLGVIESC